MTQEKLLPVRELCLRSEAGADAPASFTAKTSKLSP